MGEEGRRWGGGVCFGKESVISFGYFITTKYTHFLEEWGGMLPELWRGNFLLSMQRNTAGDSSGRFGCLQNFLGCETLNAGSQQPHFF
jgi:hypothetical protein